MPRKFQKTSSRIVCFHVQFHLNLQFHLNSIVAFCVSITEHKHIPRQNCLVAIWKILYCVKNVVCLRGIEELTSHSGERQSFV